MLISFIRHTESKLNTSNIYSDQDLGLSEKGKLQAKTIANFISTKDYQQIITSSQKRALETAKIIASAKELKIDERLVEIRKPSALLNLHAHSQDFQAIKNALLEHGHKQNWKHSDEESYYHFYDRIISFLADLSGESALIITHSAVIRMIIVITQNPKTKPQAIIRQFLDSRHTIDINHGDLVNIEKIGNELQFIAIGKII